MKVSVVISACDNRDHLFARALDTWAVQTLPKKEWELVVVDDAERESLRDLCRRRAARDGTRIRFVRIDKSRCDIPVRSFIPALTNNVGFRQSRGDVLCVTGPETLQAPKNLEVSAGMAGRDECAYGMVFKASPRATQYIGQGWDILKRRDFGHLLRVPGATQACLTRPPHPPAYWYFMAVAKRHVEKIGGVDERFLGGLCGEDDDFSNRMRMAGIAPVFEHGILGLHQDHSREDHGDGVHIDRRSEEGRKLKAHNLMLVEDNRKNRRFAANEGREWGSSSLITLLEDYGPGSKE